MTTSNLAKIRLACVALLCGLFALTPLAVAQVGGNPFARQQEKPAETKPTPTAPATIAAPPPPPIPAGLLDTGDSAMREAFGDLILVANTADSAVLRAGETAYYVRNGDDFDYDGTKVKVRITGSKVVLLTEKDKEEVFAADLGNATIRAHSGKADTSGNNRGKAGIKP